MQHRKMLMYVLVMLFAVACGGSDIQEAQEEAPAAPSATPLDPASAGSVSGLIALEGVAPEAENIRMNSDPACVSESSDSQTNYYVVGEDGALGNVFVYVKEGLEDRAFPPATESVILNQEGCRYQPHVLGIRVGQVLEIVNGDPTLHNIHATPSANDEFNMGQPIQGMRFQRAFTTPEVMVPLKCDVHGWMNAWVGVVDHPYFGVTGTNGSFDINNLPPGNYVIEAWHEMLGTQTQNVTIGESEMAELNFTFVVG